MLLLNTDIIYRESKGGYLTLIKWRFQGTSLQVCIFIGAVLTNVKHIINIYYIRLVYNQLKR